MDKIPVDDVKAFEAAARQQILTRHPEFFAEIDEKKVISEDLDKKLMSFYADFTEKYLNKSKAA